MGGTIASRVSGFVTRRPVVVIVLMLLLSFVVSVVVLPSFLLVWARRALPVEQPERTGIASQS